MRFLGVILHGKHDSDVIFTPNFFQFFSNLEKHTADLLFLRTTGRKEQVIKEQHHKRTSVYLPYKTGALLLLLFLFLRTLNLSSKK
jgi:hypothetical protein